MDKALPSKWIRKAISEAINNIEVDGVLIPCYDERVTLDINSSAPNHYILMTTQTSDVDKNNKCEWFWESSILLDIVTSYELPGNPGSRLLADDILEAVKDATNDLVLDPASGLEVIRQTGNVPANLSSTSQKENIFRNLYRLEMTIK